VTDRLNRDSDTGHKYINYNYRLWYIFSGCHHHLVAFWYTNSNLAKMRRTRNTPAPGSITANKQTDPSTVQKKSKRMAVESTHKRTSAPLQDLGVANKDAETEIAELKGKLYSK